MSGSLDRRQFTVAAALALLGGATITLSGCGGGSSNPNSPNPTPSPSPGDKVGTVLANHGHVAVITAARLSTGGELSLDIRGQANHNHTVTLTGAEVTQIAGGARVSRESSQEEQHNHTVTFN